MDGRGNNNNNNNVHDHQPPNARFEFTPTWIIAVVSSIIVIISFSLERGLHWLGQVLLHNNTFHIFYFLYFFIFSLLHSSYIFYLIYSYVLLCTFVEFDSLFQGFCTLLQMCVLLMCFYISSSI